MAKRVINLTGRGLRGMMGPSGSTVTPSDNFNTINQTGAYRSSAVNANQPVSGESTIVYHTEGAGGRRYQYAQWGNNAAIRYGGPSGAAYTSWLSLLRTGDAISTTITTITDADTATTSGYYWLGTGSLNTPIASGQFILENARRTNGIAVQTATEIRGTSVVGALTKVWVRHRTGGGNWQPWTEILTDASVSVAHYKNTESIKNFAVNGTPLTDGSLARAVNVAVQDQFSHNGLKKVAATDIGECYFTTVTETDTARLYSQTPIIGSTGAVQRRTMPVTINTSLFNTPIAAPIFRPLATSARGWLSFKYIGADPLYTALKGSIGVLTRISDTNPDAMQEMLLKLRCLNPPRYDTLDSGVGERGLANSLGGNPRPYEIRAGSLFNDPCLPITAACLATTEPNLYVGSDVGYIDLANTSEALPTTDTQGAIPTTVRTTKWMNVASYDKTKISFFLYCPRAESSAAKFPYSKARRVQIKTAQGAVRSLTDMSWDEGDNGAFTVYRLPADAAQVRIYYSARGDDVHEPSIIFKAMSAATSASVDPSKGYWRELRFDVCREVVFYPNCDYCFTFDSVDASDTLNTDFGFRFTGGLSCLFDASKVRSKRANGFFKV